MINLQEKYYEALNNLGKLGFEYSSVKNYDTFTEFTFDYNEFLVEIGFLHNSNECFLAYTNEYNDFEEIAHFQGNLKDIVQQFFIAVSE